MKTEVLRSNLRFFLRPTGSPMTAFMSFGPDLMDATHLISQVDRILEGAKPAELPFERPTKFYLRINLHIAKTVVIELSPTSPARADDVIE
ncbi:MULTISPECIES: hypothetical protein [unclassified Bradyrhizobium]|uniref:hypothetical protein n=1 Tax=unclassified Bradyrhizobium TaxID=2631580 RepID=UPI00247938BB|nr:MULTISPECIES: hypothetical protein [unclassified Bradyrhizobium]WGS18771.1 hypothetical protein MTX22_30145 [Bradyrhizobium sp. ISRA463]WGS25595.1 hypothetical protein MTX19_27720 [Bradyrhizobium sp. ISRA464]